MKDKKSISNLLKENKEEIAYKVETNLNAMPVNKRKKYFKIVFGAFLLIILLRIILFIVSMNRTATEETTDGQQLIKEGTYTKEDVLNMDLSTMDKEVPANVKSGLKDMLNDVNKSDSVK